MIDALDRVRAKYASGNQSTKGQLTPGILDQEKTGEGIARGDSSSDPRHPEHGNPQAQESLIFT